ncbi:DotU family type VI secretion system protein [Trinickia fusca]|uniref:DotU family type VI secretion system protein n=1 Tax=Trinickia fusca TaxID=2419777 RepID=A0A494X1E2_9BURK|nr:DotU family type VI secretion system protein [Trinickia fusca]RKP44535.1 DotU family type VI secretion system protein [Trinickia fusca]
MNPLNDPFPSRHGAFATPDSDSAPVARDDVRGFAEREPGPASTAAMLEVADDRNPLVAAANALLNLVPQIRYTVHHPNPGWLREHLASQVREFEARAQQAGVHAEEVGAARYCLCTALDEAAALTPWGGAANWSSDSLLVAFHNETWGGEKFFEVLDRLMQRPHEHLPLLELLYYCLALGFEGRYRVLDNGRAQLDELRQRLARTIRNVRGEFDVALSPHWRDEMVAHDGPRRLIVPMWACAAIAAVLGFGIFVALDLTLAARSDRAFAMIDRLPIPKLQQQAPEPQAVHVPAAPRLAGFLEPEIRAGLVEVHDAADRSVVVLRGDGLFESGSTSILDRYEPVLARVADALERVPGNIVVAGYTDNVPVHTARFPSNWNLSLERAQSVGRLLAARLSDPGRLRAEGRAQSDPVAPNDTPANRARNRRVEITLLAAPAPSATLAPGAAQ